jgi:hypothetical protein
VGFGGASRRLNPLIENGARSEVTIVQSIFQDTLKNVTLAMTIEDHRSVIRAVNILPHALNYG